MSEPRTSLNKPKSPMAWPLAPGPWPLAAATAALLAAAPGLSQATPIVVQPGTTAGYLYFPKATQAEELLKADLAKAKADLLKISADLDKLRKDSFEWTWDQAPTGHGWSLHRHIGENWWSSHDTSNQWSLASRVANLEAAKFLGVHASGQFDRSAYGSGTHHHIAGNDWKMCFVAGTGEMGPGERHWIYKNQTGWHVVNVHGGITACGSGGHCKMLNWHCVK
jgi:hypothetical protein